MSKIGPVRVKTVQGKPIAIGEKEFTPVARVVSFVKRSGTVKERAVFGGGGGFVFIKPTVVIEASPQGFALEGLSPKGKRRIPVRDETRRALAGMLAAALALPILLELAARLLKQPRRSSH